ncbi:MAG: DNA gyrase inhibitor YacG [Gammaproteobacteria bacterium]|nr:DNA gyrase inhibitor YacG [Gammaproteobacteria bacterium]
MSSEITCPSCKKRHTWDTKNIYRPFCSERCKLIDLGAWASEKHVIEGEELEDIDENTLENSTDFNHH